MNTNILISIIESILKTNAILLELLKDYDHSSINHYLLKKAQQEMDAAQELFKSLTDKK